MKKIVVLGVVAVLLTLGLVAMSCGAACTNDGNCEFKYANADSTSAGVCENTDSCVIFDSAKMASSILSQKNAKCDC